MERAVPMKPVDVLVDELERKPAGELVQAQPAVRLLSLAWHRAPRARLLVLVYPFVLRAPRAPLPSVNTLFFALWEGQGSSQFFFSLVAHSLCEEKLAAGSVVKR